METNGKIGQIMSINSVEEKRAVEFASQIRTLADRFAGVKGGPMILVLQDKRWIRYVHIAPAAIAMGNLRVDSRPQPIASESRFRVSRIYDLDQPPIAAGDVEELAVLAGLLLRLKPYFQADE